MSQPSAESKRLLYPNLTSNNEKFINDVILANKKFNNKITFIKDIRNYFETENSNYNRKLIAITGIGLPYSTPTAFATETVRGSLSKTFSTIKGKEIIKNLQMYILSKQFSDKFNKLYNKSMKDKKNYHEYNELVKIYEEYKKNKKTS